MAAATLSGGLPRVAIVGAGPAGFYTAHRLLDRTRARIDLIERLPSPYGLIRYGVAPDHQDVKNCTGRFAEIGAAADRVRFFGNLSVGEQNDAGPAVSLGALADAYDAVVLAVGCSVGRRLDVPGRDLANVFSGKDIVDWYNGRPAGPIAGLDLSRTEHVHIIGQGNVGLDVARILLRPAADLRPFDLPEPVLADLARSRVRSVTVAGRRGPGQMACTTKEVRALTKLAGIAIKTDTDLVRAAALDPALDRPKKRMLDLIGASAAAAASDAPKHLSFAFLQGPEAYHGDGSGRVREVEYRLNRLGDGAAAVRSADTVRAPAELVVECIGYGPVPMAGLEYDARGRIDQTDRFRVRGWPNVFAAGWAATGPTGVVATTMFEAFAAADVIAQALPAHSARPGLDSVPGTVDWPAWLQIDAAEIAAGAAAGKIREKVRTVREMLGLARA